MYVFQFMDASWRIARMTNTSFPLPIAGEARALFEAPYPTERAAFTAMALVREYAIHHPEWFAK